MRLSDKWVSSEATAIMCWLLLAGGRLSLPPGMVRGAKPSGAVSSQHSSEEYKSASLQSYPRGNFEQVTAGWAEATQFYEQTRKPTAKSDALINLAQAYQSLGQHSAARQASTASVAARLRPLNCWCCKAPSRALNQADGD